MTNTFGPRLGERIGVGGIAAILGLGGFALWIFALRRFPLVPRPDEQFIGTPPRFFYIGLFFSALTWFLLRRLAASQNREIKWGWKVAGPSSLRGSGPLRWENVLFSAVPGAMLGIIGLAFSINGGLDSSSPQSHVVKIEWMGRHVPNRGSASHYVRVADWRQKSPAIQMTVSREMFEKRETGDTLVITTGRGFLGHEWIVRKE